LTATLFVLTTPAFAFLTGSLAWRFLSGTSTSGCGW
jgi:hypothetical protein